MAGEHDRLGMALFYKKDQVGRILEERDDHLVVFKRLDHIGYYFLASLVQAKDVIKFKGDFMAHLDKKMEELDWEDKF